MIDCFVGVVIGEVVDCRKIKVTSMLTRPFEWIKSLNGAHHIIVSNNKRNVNLYSR